MAVRAQISSCHSHCRAARHTAHATCSGSRFCVTTVKHAMAMARGPQVPVVHACSVLPAPDPEAPEAEGGFVRRVQQLDYGAQHARCWWRPFPHTRPRPSQSQPHTSTHPYAHTHTHKPIRTHTPISPPDVVWAELLQMDGLAPYTLSVELHSHPQQHPQRTLAHALVHNLVHTLV